MTLAKRKGGTGGAKIARAMNAAILRANAIGLDSLYHKLGKKKVRDADGLWLAFDITWLTVLAVEVDHLTIGGD